MSVSLIGLRSCRLYFSLSSFALSELAWLRFHLPILLGLGVFQFSGEWVLAFSPAAIAVRFGAVGFNSTDADRAQDSTYFSHAFINV